ncbi:hypothetical protein [Lacisediminihabitans sp. H27-G8]|uniref:hypothetical protein n=1 Tax=Lacisediminihabitans sp. H27-G8 TaxID=3111909 RepID=UPI0038FCD03C
MSGVVPRGRPMGIGHRFAFLFATPWWRAVWVVGAIVWFVILTAVAAIDPTHDQGLGALSVVPLFTVLFDVLRRQRALRNR